MLPGSQLVIDGEATRLGDHHGKVLCRHQCEETLQHLRTAISRSEVTRDQNQQVLKQLTSKKQEPPMRLELMT